MNWPTIAPDTPLEEVNTIHKRIWNYVIKHDVKPDTPYRGDCAFCEYSIYRCKYCPVSSILACFSYNGLYTKWRRSEGPEKEAYAIAIRDALDTLYLETKKEEHYET